MKRFFVATLMLLTLACKENKTSLTVQEIVDKSILDSGGERYNNHSTSFFFRNRKYSSESGNGGKVLKRISFIDSITITDVKTRNGFRRYVNDSLVNLSDSIANRYSNSVNSVHYFARLPFGLNDNAVKKELLGEETIKGKEHYKVKVTFDQNGGGDDFDDVYVYWFDKKTFKPNYLAYDFHVNGGGQRFREAYNERYINGIRFVDYNNFKSKSKETSILDIGKLFEKGELELLSKIEISKPEVTSN
ncbi:deoxyribose-phosphate aldolase [Flagellimonas sp. HMM57]|uniref:DUF6503 family protein n=1 Tax=unclassified Flagellimonas TaxID=2644544 RepID=UPI0013D7872B|nr:MULTISPECIES: DUF6503 family protein [unclassified Flagellimonas]UII75615.1 deoxyribose-phosphate aldolase [Flagellimonas sp. HMM57]